MGFAQVPHELLANADVRPTYIALYAALFFRLDSFLPPQTGSASLAQLQRTSGIADVKTARAALAWLEAHGYVKVTDRRGGRIGLKYSLQPKGQGYRFSVPQGVENPVPQGVENPAGQGVENPAGQGSRMPVPTPEPFGTEVPPEGWGGFAALLEGKGLDVALAGPALVAMYDQLAAKGWRPQQVLAEVWDQAGLSLADGHNPFGLLRTRLDGLRAKPSPVQLRERREDQADAKDLARLMETERAAAERQLTEAVWDGMTDQERAELEEAAAKEAGRKPPPGMVQKLARTLALQRRGINGMQIDQLAAKRLAARQEGRQ